MERITRSPTPPPRTFPTSHRPSSIWETTSVATSSGFRSKKNQSKSFLDASEMRLPTERKGNGTFKTHRTWFRLWRGWTVERDGRFHRKRCHRWLFPSTSEREMDVAWIVRSRRFEINRFDVPLAPFVDPRSKRKREARHGHAEGVLARCHPRRPTMNRDLRLVSQEEAIDAFLGSISIQETCPRGRKRSDRSISYDRQCRGPCLYKRVRSQGRVRIRRETSTSTGRRRLLDGRGGRARGAGNRTDGGPNANGGHAYACFDREFRTPNSTEGQNRSLAVFAVHDVPLVYPVCARIHLRAARSSVSSGFFRLGCKREGEMSFYRVHGFLPRPWYRGVRRLRVCRRGRDGFERRPQGDAPCNPIACERGSWNVVPNTCAFRSGARVLRGFPTPCKTRSRPGDHDAFP